jgi:hypothetical protein
MQVQWYLSENFLIISRYYQRIVSRLARLDNNIHKVRGDRFPTHLCHSSKIIDYIVYDSRPHYALRAPRAIF